MILERSLASSALAHIFVSIFITFIDYHTVASSALVKVYRATIDIVLTRTIQQHLITARYRNLIRGIQSKVITGHIDIIVRKHIDVTIDMKVT